MVAILNVQKPREPSSLLSRCGGDQRRAVVVVRALDRFDPVLSRARIIERREPASDPNYKGIYRRLSIEPAGTGQPANPTDLTNRDRHSPA